MYEKTSIEVTKSTREALKSFGRKGDTYNDVIMRLIQAERSEDVLNVIRSEDPHITRSEDHHNVILQIIRWLERVYDSASRDQIVRIASEFKFDEHATDAEIVRLVKDAEIFEPVRFSDIFRTTGKWKIIVEHRHP